MKVGTKSILFGVHAFWWHPIMVAIAWIKLYGFPTKLPIWVSFITHDLGYLGKPNMDGDEGETHVELGAKILSRLFDKVLYTSKVCFGNNHIKMCKIRDTKWYDFSLYHSRYYAKKHNTMYSKLCVADKYSICIEPKCFYLLRATLSKEIYEYMGVNDGGRSSHTAAFARYKFNIKGKKLWFNHVRKYMKKWVIEHKDLKEDTWTKTNKHGKIS